MVLFFLACTDETVECSTEARASVQVEVIDERGDRVDATVAWDGGLCEDFGTSWVCGWERSGEMHLFVSAEGYADQELVVDVGMTEDGCHVETELLTVTLVAEDCSSEAPALLVSPVSGAEPVVADSVEWSACGEERWSACEDQGDGSWACARNRSGCFDLRGSAAGYDDAGVEGIEVGAGECAPQTVEVDLEFTASCPEPGPAVRVEVVDGDGAPVTDASLSWMPCDAAVEPEACTPESGSTWACGDEAGCITVLAEAEGWQDASASVEVGEDECGLLTEELSLVLASECVSDEYAVYVHTFDENGSPIVADLVRYGLCYADMAPVDCDWLGDNLWACGDQADCYDLYGYDSDNADFFVTGIDVGSDECGLVAVDYDMWFDEG